jgi:hypothetical protein
MPIADILHSIGGQRTDGVDGSIIELGPPLREDRV